ncbi:hypothetical protein QAD02_022769 [Eretmocerus hayati]|uniref:Uncharacterized protein n=1 Tax=Eretmocerus hayati TaxID=131215 RepID=A0ACC2PU80_9HYME|nr:hypothetical protein QAD02_022769 [Eretmocerus hayati]
MPRKRRDQDVNTRLFDAVKSGSLDKVEYIIKTYGLSYSSAWARGYALLCTAFKEDHTDIAELLLRHGSRVNNISNVNIPSNTPLHYAVYSGDRTMVIKLLVRGARVNDKNHCGQTPLFKAMEAESSDIVGLLIDHGADVNVIDNHSVTPLLSASHRGLTEIVENLLDHGAHVNHITTRECELCSKEGYTPLLAAVVIGSEEIVKLLLAKGANAKTITRYGYTPLQIACSKGLDNIAKLLLDHDAEIDFVGESGKSALHLAVERGCLEIVENILQRAPDINSHKNVERLDCRVLHQHDEVFKKILDTLLQYGISIKLDDLFNPKFFHCTIREGYTRIVQDFLDCGANVDMLCDISPDEGFTPIHSAMKYNQNEVAELLIKHGADVNIRDRFGKVPIFYAIENNNSKVLDILFSTNQDVEIDLELLKMAIDKGYVEVIKALLQFGADVNTSDTYGRTPLLFSVLSKENELCERLSHEHNSDDDDIKGKITQLLLSKGALTEAQVVKTGATALHVATQRGYIEVVKNLLGHKANVNAKRKDGVTAIQLAVYNSHAKIVQMLLEYGASCDSEYYQYSDLEPPLILSATLYFEQIAESLLSFGFDVDCRDRYGRTALHIASSRGIPGVVTVLLKYGSDINIVSEQIGTPLDYAMYGKDSYLIQIWYSESESSDSEEDDCSYIDEPSYTEWDQIFENLKRHVVKLRTAGLYVSEMNLSLLDDGDMEYFEGQCREELMLLREEKVDPNFSWYDILKNSKHVSVSCLKDGNANQLFESSRCETKFPIYGSLLRSRFMMALRRDDLLKQGYEIMQTSSQNFRDLPYDCFEKIFNLISDEDLKSLSRNGKCCSDFIHTLQTVDTTISTDVHQLKLSS